MKFLNQIIAILLLLSCCFALNANAQGVVLQSFQVKSQGADILVKWEINDEHQISSYNLYRKYGEQGSFDHISLVKANGTGSYVYLDNDIFKNQSNLITYELRVVKNGRTYRFQSTLSHNPTAVQRTWGSIKSMFRQ